MSISNGSSSQVRPGITRATIPFCSQHKQRHASAQLKSIDEQMASLENDMALVRSRRAFLMAETTEARELDDQVRLPSNDPSAQSLTPNLWAEQQNPSQEIKFYLETSTALPGGRRLYGEQLLVDEVFYTCMTGFKAKDDGSYVEILGILLRKLDSAAENGRAGLNFLDEQKKVCEQNLARSHWQAVFSSSQGLKRASQVREVEDEEADGNLNVLAKRNAVAQRPLLRRQRSSASESVGSYGSLDKFLHEAFLRYDSDDDMVDEEREDIEPEEMKWHGQERGGKQADLSGGGRARFDSLLSSPIDLIADLF